MVSLPKSKLNCTEVSISKASIDAITSQGEFTLINNELKEFYDMKE